MHQKCSYLCTDKRSSLRKYGYALRGKQAIAEKVLVRGKRHSVISAMGMDGILDILITRQSVDGNLFYEFVEHELLHQLLPFDGINRNSVVILDNASIHNVPELESLTDSTGAIFIYSTTLFTRPEPH